MKYILMVLISLGLMVLFLQTRLKHSDLDKPVFLKVDDIVNNHQTKINIAVQSFYKPNKEQLIAFEKDYSAIWAHLNYMYNTGDILKGKEYYTQNWFKLVANEYKTPLKTGLQRIDSVHNVKLINWSFDGLVCNIIDSGVVLKTKYNNKVIDTQVEHFVIALLFQGDHWRIEGLRQLGK